MIINQERVRNLEIIFLCVYAVPFLPYSQNSKNSCSGVVIAYDAITRGTHALKNKKHQPWRTTDYTMHHKKQQYTTINHFDNYPNNNPGLTVSPYFLSVVIVFAILCGYPDAYYCYWLAS
jgi:hypothetical protein